MKKGIVLIGLVSLLGLVGCSQEEKTTIKIAQQLGITSSPLLLAEQQGFLASNLPEGVNYEFITITGGGTGVREALVTEEIQYGLMGLPPLIVGLDKDMPIEPIMGMGYSEFRFISNDEKIQRFEQMTGDERIALVQFGSGQHMQLSLVAEQVFGEATKFDQTIVVMPEDVAVAAMELGKEVDAYFGPQPYTYRVEQLEGTQTLFKTSDYLGDVTSLALVGNEIFNQQNKEITDAVQRSLQQAIEYMNTNPKETLDILSEAYGMEKEMLAEAIQDFQPNEVILGYDMYKDYMYTNNLIDQEADELSEVLYK